MSSEQTTAARTPQVDIDEPADDDADTALDSPGQVGTRGAASDRAWHVPAIVWWIAATHLTVLLAYSVILPTYRAPDEPLHVDLAHLVSEELTYPAWDERDTGANIQRSLNVVRFGTRSANLTADEAPPRSERPSLEDLADPPIDTGINQLPQHPPLYYAVAGGAMWATEAIVGDPIGDFLFETWFYRLVSIAFVAPLPLIVWRVSQLLTLPRPVAVAAMLLPLAIPQYVHIGASVNNDSLMLLLIWLLTPVVVRVAGGAVGPRTAALAGALTGLGIFTKGFAVVMPLWVAAGLLVSLRRGGRARLPAIARFGAVYSAVVLAVGGWWWVRNVVLYGKPLPSRFNEIAPPSPDGARDISGFIETWAVTTTRRFWGDFGWYDTSLAGHVIAVATVVCLVGLAVALLPRDRVAGTPIGTRLLVAAPFLLLVSVQFANALRGYISTGRQAGLQGRYWFGAMAGLAIIVSLGLARLAGRWQRHVPVATLVGVAGMQLAAMAALFGFYWGAPGSSLTDRLAALAAWAPLPRGVIIAAALVGGAVIAATVVQVVSGSIGVDAHSEDDDRRVPPTTPASAAGAGL